MSDPQSVEQGTYKLLAHNAHDQKYYLTESNPPLL